MLKTCARERGRPCRRRKNFCSKWTTCIEATWGLCCARTNMEYSSSCVGEALADPYVRTSRLSVCVQAAQAIGGGHDGVCGVERSPRPLRLHGAQAALA